MSCIIPDYMAAPINLVPMSQDKTVVKAKHPRGPCLGRCAQDG